MRRVFLSCEQVLIQFYKPFIASGRPVNEGTWRSRRIRVEELSGVTLKNAIIESVRYNAAKFNPNMPRNNGDNTYTISGKALSFMNSPVLMSNLEEIYIDPFLLMSSSYTGGQNPQTIQTMLESVAIRGNVSMLQPQISAILSRLMPAACSNANAIDSSFKRLRTIGVIYGLESFITPSSKGAGDSIAQKLLDKRNNLCFYSELTKNGIISEQQMAIMKLKPNSYYDNGRIVTRPSFYKFDLEDLTPYASKFETDVLESYGGRNNKAVENKETSDLEQTLLSIGGDGITDKVVLSIAVNRLSSSDKAQLLKTFSPENQNRYRNELR